MVPLEDVFHARQLLGVVVDVDRDGAVAAEGSESYLMKRKYTFEFM